MTYVLEALVADADLLDVLSQDLPPPAPRPGPRPHPDDPGTRPRPRRRPRRPALGFWQLPSGFDRVLSDRSQDGPIAYVEAECFGGTGEQHSAVWDAGALALGPLHLPEYQPSPPTAARSRRHCGASARRRGTPSTSSWRWAVR